jgi:hypothetical protein
MRLRSYLTVLKVLQYCSCRMSSAITTAPCRRRWQEVAGAVENSHSPLSRISEIHSSLCTEVLSVLVQYYTFYSSVQSTRNNSKPCYTRLLPSLPRPLTLLRTFQPSRPPSRSGISVPSISFHPSPFPRSTISVKRFFSGQEFLVS